LIAHVLGLVVAVMGIVFIYVAFRTKAPADGFLLGLRPLMAEGALPLVIGLIGTTIVPYNLFLASGISQGQDIREMRIGIIVAVLIGGFISIAIMVVGTQVVGEFSFVGLSDAMRSSLGAWAAVLFGIGLFAAGMSSSVTAPMAAAVTARSLFGAQTSNWSVKSLNFRLVWGSVLFIGLFFGLTGVKPIPAILLAQVINGILLPIVAVFLLLAVNDRSLLPEAFVNRALTNLLTIFIVGITCFLGLNNIWRALTGVWPVMAAWDKSWMYADLFFTIVIMVLLAIRVLRR
jgi:Mn2+/Fe2+ NRAMP family transporter